jgi:hypothetical protein
VILLLLMILLLIMIIIIIIIKLGVYIMAPSPISTAYFVNPSNQSVSLYVSRSSLLGNGSVKIPLSLLGQGSLKRLPGQRNTLNDIRIFGLVFYAGRVLTKETKQLLLA